MHVSVKFIGYIGNQVARMHSNLETSKAMKLDCGEGKMILVVKRYYFSRVVKGDSKVMIFSLHLFNENVLFLCGVAELVMNS